MTVTPPTDSSSPTGPASAQRSMVPAQRRDPPDIQRAALAWQNPFEGVSLWEIARMIPRSALRTWRIAWRTDRWMLAGLLAAQVVQGAAAAVMLLGTAAAMGPLLGEGGAAQRLHHAAGALLVVAAAAGAGRLAGEVVLYADKRLTPRLVEYADNAVIAAVTGVEASAYSVPAFAEGIEAAEVGANRYAQVVPDLRKLVSALVKLAAAGTVATTLHPLLALVLIAAVVPTGVGALLNAKLEHAASAQSLGDKSMRGSMRWYLITPRYADEIRANNMVDYLRFWYGVVVGRATTRSLDIAPRLLRTGLAVGACSGLLVVVMWGVLAWLTLTGRVSLAVAATAIVALRMCLGSLQDAVTAVAAVFASSTFISGWTDFLDTASRLAFRRGEQTVTAPDTIELRAARLSYPNRPVPAVAGVDLTLRRGEMVAVVGENGSGKSTLIRLLTGLLLPDGGRVLWDGVDLADADPQSVWDQVGLVPQDYARWPFPLRENVNLGRPRDDDEDRVWRSLNAVGMGDHARELSSGLDTLLAAQWWGGVTLSGGQWQRVACARALYRDAPVLVLDEPTAALDTRGEHAIFQQLRERAADRITIIVTHRLHNVRHADKVIVMDNGAIRESGTYQELVDRGGLFAELHALADQ
ncbi:ABC transporter ATP-binding protein [Actinomadura geliboluensis]|uniref:ABC transporter ATP-binding protein n=1 Tax=Actinomadura geliboluensis TaxID=882440 RepID=UPI0037238C30